MAKVLEPGLVDGVAPSRGSRPNGLTGALDGNPRLRFGLHPLPELGAQREADARLRVLDGQVGEDVVAVVVVGAELVQGVVAVRAHLLEVALQVGTGQAQRLRDVVDAQVRGNQR